MTTSTSSTFHLDAATTAATATVSNQQTDHHHPEQEIDKDVDDVDDPNDDMTFNDGIIMSSKLWSHHQGCPLREEEYILSIVCGNTRCHWAIHESIQREYYPTFFWKTSPPVFPNNTATTNNAMANANDNDGINVNMIVDPNDIPKLYNLIPYVLKDMIYGKPELITNPSDRGNQASSQQPSQQPPQPQAAPMTVSVKESDDKYCTSSRAATYRSVYRIPYISVYIIATNSFYRRNMVSLWKNAMIPCRLYLLHNHDFSKIPKIITLNNNSTNDNNNITADGNTNHHDSSANKNIMNKRIVSYDSNHGDNPNQYYHSMGIDRIASLVGAQYLLSKQTPLLIIDGGTAMTYTATNHAGTFVGGGIGCGLRMKLRSLYDYTGGLPYITYDILYQYLQHALPHEGSLPTAPVKPKEDLPLPCFTMNTEHAIITSVLRETTIHLIHIISSWMKEHLEINWNELVSKATIDRKKKADSNNTSDKPRGEEEGTTTATSITTHPPTILLSGGDGKIYQLLLQENHSGIIQTMEQQDDNAATLLTTIRYAIRTKMIQMIFNSHLIHHGIQAMLLQRNEVKTIQREQLLDNNQHNNNTNNTNQQHKKIQQELWMARENIIGQRIATIYGMGERTLVNIIQGISEIPKRATISYGTVINVTPNYQRNTLDRDLFIIFWDNPPPPSSSSNNNNNRNNNSNKDHYVYDVTPRLLYDYLILYSKANEKLKEKDLDRQVKLEKKALQAKEAAMILAQRSDSVKALIEARLAQQQQPARKNAITLAGVNENTIAIATTTAAASMGATISTTTAVGMTANKRSIDAVTNINNTTTTTTENKNSGFSNTAAIANNNISSKKSKKSQPNHDAKNVAQWNAKDFVKKRVAKNFDGTLYYGSVKKLVPAHENDEGVDLWLVEYDDGDSEDLEKDELVQCIILWFSNKTKDIIHSQQRLHDSKNQQPK